MDDTMSQHHSAGFGNLHRSIDLAEARARLEADLERLTEQDLLRETAAAIHRIDSGCYGRCQSCGGQISAERLHALPRAAMCVHCHQFAEHH